MRKIPGWVYVILFIILLAAAKLLFFSKKTEGSTAQKGKEAPPIAVNYYVVKTSNFENNVFSTGKIGAFNQVDIIPEVSGRIISVNFKEGETVNKGSLLVKLNDADLQAQLLKIHTQLKLAEQKLERLRQLISIKGISQEEFDMQENEVATIKADEAYTLAQIAKCNIAAPFTGVAGLRNISEGSFVNASTPIVSLVQLSPLYVEFSVPEKYSRIFKAGGKINFSSEGVDSTTTFAANIYAIEPRVDESTNTIKARALYSGKQTLFPGSFVKVFVDLGNTENVLMVPSQAVIATLKGQKVFVSRSGIATEVPVKIGVRTDRDIQVTEGLTAGDTVLTTGLLSLKKNSKVNLIQSNK